jgi:MFS family permease
VEKLDPGDGGAVAGAPAAPRHLAAPWWAVLTLPFGLAVGVASVAVPFVLRERGLSMALIATVSSVAQLPHGIKFLWAPALDSGPRRRSWFLGSIGVTALALALAALVPPDPDVRIGPLALLWVYTALLFLAQAAVGTSTAAVLALMAVTVPEARRGAASGWQTAGNLVGTSFGGSLATWMLVHLPPPVTAAALAAMCLACTAPALFIEETPLPRRNAGELLLELLREVGQTLRSREGWTGMLLCLTPVGTGAMTNLFSGLARDYSPDAATNEHLVIVVVGTLGGVVSAAGALPGGYLADRMPRRLAYIVFGAVTAVSALAMAFARATPATFTAGSLAYQFANGLCYAAFYAFVFELVGKRRGVTTQIALYTSASNLAISYVTWLDGRASDLAPLRGWTGRSLMLGADAAATFVGIGILALVTLYTRRSRAST